MSKRQVFLVGRFQPFHRGHKNLVDKALELANGSSIIIFIGSALAANTTRNPFSIKDRMECILASYSDSERKRIVLLPLPDFNTDEEWVSFIDMQLTCIFKEAGPRLSVVMDKDEDTALSNQLLRKVPMTDQYVSTCPQVINATDIRRQIFIEKKMPKEIPELTYGTQKYLETIISHDG